MSLTNCPGVGERDGDGGCQPHLVDEAQFYVAKGKRDRVCKPCRRFIQRRYERRHEDRIRKDKGEWMRRKRLRQYGLSLEDFERLVERHAGRCGVCHQERELQIDHCHATGVVRGLLCGQCNKLLGLAGDDVERLRAAIRYLESSRCTDVNAAWCPIHGDCTCETETRGIDAPCPLHDWTSPHGEAQFHDGLVPVEG